MVKIKTFVFNEFQENTFVVYDAQSKACMIIDPGCNSENEQKALTTYITEQELKPQWLVNTHCHIDHILGNAFVSNTYGLQLSAHRAEQQLLASAATFAQMYNLPYTISPQIEVFLEHGQRYSLGGSEFRVLHVPGHSPGSVVLHFDDSAFLVAGDVLFRRSIGRSDLPGGNHNDLLNNIRKHLFVLPKETVVYPGHGPKTTIGEEMRENPFF